MQAGGLIKAAHKRIHNSPPMNEQKPAGDHWDPSPLLVAILLSRPMLRCLLHCLSRQLLRAHPATILTQPPG
jgi:hypothetical protein